MRQQLIPLLASLLLGAAPAAAQEETKPDGKEAEAAEPAAPSRRPTVSRPETPAPAPPAKESPAPPAPPPAPPPVARLELFNQRDFKGTTLVLTEPNSNIQFTPRASRVEGGAWLICARPFFGGRCDTIDGTNPRLGLHRSFSGTVRSARPVDMPAPPQQ